MCHLRRAKGYQLSLFLWFKATLKHECMPCTQCGTLSLSCTNCPLSGVIVPLRVFKYLTMAPTVWESGSRVAWETNRLAAATPEPSYSLIRSS